MAIALGVLVLVTAIVYLDREGYNDNADGSLSLLDAFYYSTVTLSTTGYGDISPYSDAARLVNTVVITPLRIVFLVALIGTTIEVLTTRTRADWRESRWRQRMIGHTVIAGFGVKGRAAAKALTESGVAKDKIVVIDDSPVSIEDANALGFSAVLGDATRNEVLQRARVSRARAVVVAANDDSKAVLITLSARRLTKTATIVAAVREAENLPLLRQSGANSVITSSEAAGRLLGISADKPSLGAVAQDLLVTGMGLDLEERAVREDEIGKHPSQVPALIVAVQRGPLTMRYDDPELHDLGREDRVIAVRSVDPAGQQPGGSPAPHLPAGPG
jgi:voltage-gated potassium channel